MPRRTIRLRITTVATIGVAAVLAAAGLVLVVQQRRALTSSLDQTLERRADDILTLLDSGSDGDALIVASGASTDDEDFVQLIDERGHVIAATSNLAGAPALQVEAPTQGRTIANVGGLALDDDDVFRVLSVRADDMTLHVGTAFEVVDEGTRSLIASLSITIPALVALLAALTWWLVGRTLRPVEAIRAEVAEIGSRHLDRRVPRPGTEDEIDRLAATMNEMLARLQDSVERQQRFVADASHELRSPLTRLRAELELALGSNPDPGETSRLESLLAEVAAMQRMVDDLLHLAQADARRAPHRPVPLDLDDIVLREGARLSADRLVPIDLRGVSAASVVGDGGQLARAIDNLLDNAMRHARSGVIVSLGEADGLAVLTVTDDGPGIPAEHAGTVFERFGRVDRARTAATGGTGLGLAIAREIIERHGGTIRLANPGEPGAVFEVRMPLAG